MRNTSTNTRTMPCLQQHRTRSRRHLILRAAAAMASIQCANAAPFPGSLQSKTLTVPVVGGQDLTINTNGHSLLPKNKTPSQRRRQRILPKITSLRGGSSSNRVEGNIDGAGNSRGIADGISGIAESSVCENNRRANIVHGGRGGSIHPSSILSTAVLIVTQSLNVASAAIVLSGYFGAWVASWMVGKLYKVLPTLAKNGVSVGDESNNFFLGKYRLTALASIGFLMLHAIGIQSNDAYSRASDASFVAILWVYSRLVDPILGGAIGCTHLSLGVVSTILENPSLTNALDGLGDIRLKKLGQYADEEDPYIPPGEKRIAMAPVSTSRLRSGFGASVANAMGSVSMLISFPQYCLGLYLLGGTLVAWSSTTQFEGVWKRFGNWIRWLGEGVCARTDENGELGCGIDASFIDNVTNERIDTWKLSRRLVALYWVVALAKATVAYMIL